MQVYIPASTPCSSFINHHTEKIRVGFDFTFFLSSSRVAQTLTRQDNSGGPCLWLVFTPTRSGKASGL